MVVKGPEHTIGVANLNNLGKTPWKNASGLPLATTAYNPGEMALTMEDGGYNTAAIGRMSRQTGLRLQRKEKGMDTVARFFVTRNKKGEKKVRGTGERLGDDEVIVPKYYETREQANASIQPKTPPSKPTKVVRPSRTQREERIRREATKQDEDRRTSP